MGFVQDGKYLSIMIEAEHGIAFYTTRQKYEADIKVFEMASKSIQNIHRFCNETRKVPYLPSLSFVFTNSQEGDNVLQFFFDLHPIDEKYCNTSNTKFMPPNQFIETLEYNSKNLRNHTKINYAMTAQVL